MVKLLMSYIANLAIKKVAHKLGKKTVKIDRVVLKPYDKDRFELTQDYIYKDVKIPKEYKTNGANVPRIFYPLFPPNSPEYLSAVVVHDFLCDEAETFYILGQKTQTRSKFKFADETLREMMSALGCSIIKTNIFYYACRAWHLVRYSALSLRN